MKKLRLTRVFTLSIVAAFGFALSSCDYDVPVTSNPTSKVNEKLVGDWVSQGKTDMMKVRKLDDFTYIVSFNGYLLRAYHSDIDGTPFVSVQDIDSAQRKYSCRTWKLSDDGQELTLRTVSTKVVPKETKDTIGIQKLLRKNLQSPDLFENEMRFTKVDSPT